VTHSGFVLIADITGYTTYLKESELEHAQQTLTDLLELLVGQSRPPFVVAQPEGDAVMSYAFDDDSLGAQSLLERIETTYRRFRRAIELMVLNNSCQCNACANVSSLDLKFFLHHGVFAIQPVGTTSQLVGAEINRVHRLLKNSVTPATGIAAYLLVTEAATQALGVDADEERMRSHVEDLADFGETHVWIKDMHEVDVHEDGDRTFYEPEDVLGTVEVEIDAPVEVVWEAANQSDLRNLFVGADRFDVIDRRDGRIGEGSTYVCHHGDTTVPQLVLAWEPFERVVLQQRVPLPGQRPTAVILDLRFGERGDRTVFSSTATRPFGPFLQRRLAQLLLKARGRRMLAEMEVFGQRVAEGFHADHGTAAPTVTADAIREPRPSPSDVDPTPPEPYSSASAISTGGPSGVSTASKVSSSFSSSTSTTIVVPDGNSPSRIFSESTSSSIRWIARRNGRAPSSRS